jgi:hypothetical protein
MYRIRVCIGSLISVLCLGFAVYALYQLVRGGSCASGGNYVSVRQCPPGTEKWAWVLPGAIIGGLLSFFLGTFKGFGPAPEAAANRGVGPVGRPEPFNPAGLLDGRVIVASSHVFTRGQTPASDQMFTPGKPPASGQAFAPGQTPGPGLSGEGQDPIVRLQRLRELLDAGTLTPTEFELAKAKILDEM